MNIEQYLRYIRDNNKITHKTLILWARHLLIMWVYGILIMMHYNLKTEKQFPHWYCFPEYSRKQMKLVKILCRHSVDKKIEDSFRKIECYRYIVYAIVEDNHFSAINL
jgi:hypothetical protein